MPLAMPLPIDTVFVLAHVDFDRRYKRRKSVSRVKFKEASRQQIPWRDNDNPRDGRHKFRAITFDSGVLPPGLISRVNIESPDCINFARILPCKSRTRQRSPLLVRAALLHLY